MNNNLNEYLPPPILNINLGIYYFDTGDKEEARKLFVKAKEMDPKTHEIDEWISKVNNC